MAALTLALATTEYLALRGPLETLGHLSYRVAYWLTFPAQLLIARLHAGAPPHGPILRSVAAGMLSPLVYTLLWSWIEKRRQRRDLAPRKTAEEAAVEGGSRRRFMSIASRSAGVAILGVGGYASLGAPFRFVVRRYKVSIANLPPALRGLRLVQLSDTHYGPFVPLSHIERAITEANRLSPDVVLLTGDYVHSTKAAIAPGVGVFSQLRAKLGVVAVLGNHDHWEDAPATRHAFAAIGVPMLDNDRLFCTRSGLTPSSQGNALCIAGVGDLWTDRVDLDGALRGVSPEMPRIVLSHNPDFASRIADDQRVDVVFSGHTHGGQIALPGVGPLVVPSRYGQKYAGGLCQGPRCAVVVSRGVGMSVLPLRVNVPPEIVLVELVASPRDII